MPLNKEDILDISLYKAAERGDDRKVNELLEKGANCMRMIDALKRPVDIAVVMGFDNIVKIFLNSGQIKDSKELISMKYALYGQAAHKALGIISAKFPAGRELVKKPLLAGSIFPEGIPDDAELNKLILSAEEIIGGTGAETAIEAAESGDIIASGCGAIGEDKVMADISADIERAENVSPCISSASIKIELTSKQTPELAIEAAALTDDYKTYEEHELNSLNRDVSIGGRTVESSDSIIL